MADEVRLIDAIALERTIQEQIGKCMIKVFDPSVNLILQDIRNAPAIEAEPDNGWISVEDRLPDECEDVLIYCPEFLEEIRKAFYTEGDFYAEKEDLIVKPAPNGYCTHWQHLPKPPKGE